MFVRLSVCLVIATSLVLCVAPIGATLGPSGIERHNSLMEAQGWGVTIPLAVPVLLAALPLAPLPVRLKAPACVVSALLLLCFVFLASPSIGMFYAPIAFLMIIAAMRLR